MRLGIALLLFNVVFSLLAQNHQDKVFRLAQDIEWHGQSSVKIPFGKRLIYVDPFKIPQNDTPNVVLVTHGHSDHLNVNEIAKLTSNQAVIVAPVDCEGELRENGFDNLFLVKPGDFFELDGVQIAVVKAYNIVKTSYHPVEKGWVGYVISYDGISIYHPGDTERIPEMKTIKCDIAFMPLGQTYTMNSVNEAIESVKDVHPLVAIPFHYGIYEGNEDDAKRFKEALSGLVSVDVKDLNDK